MANHKKERLTPRRGNIDVTPFEGLKVLGEPLDVLFSAFLRLRVGPIRKDGLAELSANLTDHEAQALERAMARAEPSLPGDPRSRGQRDCDRFLITAARVFGAVDVVMEIERRGRSA